MCILCLGVIQLPPPYSSGVYDSSRCGVLEEEQNILLKKVGKRDEKVEKVECMSVNNLSLCVVMIIMLKICGVVLHMKHQLCWRE